MKKLYTLLYMLIALATAAGAQENYSQINEDGVIMDPAQRRSRTDSLGGGHKEIPRGLRVWTVDERFGDRTAAVPDTLPYMYMNSIFTTGLRGEFNTLGNVGAPRQNRIYADREEYGQFVFTEPYSYFYAPPAGRLHFTNTLSPITNVSFNTAGNRTNGEDHLKAVFAVNAGKALGVGFKFDYIYGRGYYQNQSTSHFDYTLYGSYLGERYQAHAVFSTNHEKAAENGGITDDRYITHPELFDDNYRADEIPTVLQKNWNRNDNQHIFLTHRYSVGFNRKVPMTDDEIKARKFAIASRRENEAARAKERARRRAQRDGGDFDEEAYDSRRVFAGRPDDARIAGDEPLDTAKTAASERITVAGKAAADSLMAAQLNQSEDTAWLKDEYVPVTSFIHTLHFDNYSRIYEAYSTPDDYYENSYYNLGRLTGDSIYDKTTHYSLRNTVAVALLEGFNKWAKAGVKLFATSELRHFNLPDSLGGTQGYNEHSLSIGAQLAKTNGRALHYNLLAETWVVGEDAGQLTLEARADLNLPFLGDTVRIDATAAVQRQKPTFYFRHYHARHFWWDNDLDQQTRTRIEGQLTMRRTGTTLRLALNTVKNYTYLAQQYTITDDFHRKNLSVAARQHSGNISILTAQLQQNLSLGPVHWETVLTYQNSSNSDVLPLPAFNLYTNLYLRFRIARVLLCDLGADMRYFSKYYAPDYSPALGQFAVQENPESKTELGNYPLLNAYANLHLKHARFFVMMSHVNAGSGRAHYFLTPHYPLNQRILRFGVSWNFFN